MAEGMSDEELRTMFSSPKNAPPSARHLGMEVLDFSVTDGWVEVAFTPRPEFGNPLGVVQGGFVSAMLDDAMGVAASIHARFTKVVPTLQLNVVFLLPTPFERVLARGQVVRLGKTTAQLQGELRTVKGVTLATATASAAVRDFRMRQSLT